MGHNNYLQLSPRELLLAELNGTFSLWEHGRDHSIIGPRTARDLLAHWAGLRRLAGDPLDDIRGLRLDTLVRAAPAVLGSRCAPLARGFASGWITRAKALWRLWDDATSAEHDDIGWTAQLLFDDLDRMELAEWTMRLLLPLSALYWALRPVLTSFAAEITEAEHYLADNPEIFVDRADEISAVFYASKPKLVEERPDLWITLLKHRRIEEHRELLKSLSPIRRTQRGIRAL